MKEVFKFEITRTPNEELLDCAAESVVVTTEEFTLDGVLRVFASFLCGCQYHAGSVGSAMQALGEELVEAYKVAD